MKGGEAIGKLALVAAGAATSAILSRQVSNAVSFLSPTVTGVALAAGAYALYDKDDTRSSRDINFFLLGLLGGALGSGISNISGLPLDKIPGYHRALAGGPGNGKNVQVIIE
jgi:hypothetical protein